MMAQLVEQRIRNAWVAGSSPARGSLSSASRACISLQKFFVCEISTSVVHGLPKPVRRVRLPYLALLFFHPPFSLFTPSFSSSSLFSSFTLSISSCSLFLLSQRKPLRTNFAVLRYNLPIFFIPLHQISERYEYLISIQHLLTRKK